MEEKLRYSDQELQEFKDIINEKLALARRDYEQMMRFISFAEELYRDSAKKRKMSNGKKTEKE